MNWVDLLIVVIFALYVFDGYRRGFLKLAWELVGLVVAFLFALKFYPVISDLVKNVFQVSDLYSKPIAFLGIWFITQGIFYLIGRLLSFYTPSFFKESKFNHYAGLIPAIVKGFIFVSVILILFLIIPINVRYKKMLNQSLIGSRMINIIARIENEIANVFSSDASSLSVVTQPLDESSKLNFSTKDMYIDEILEKELLDMLNLEREKIGLHGLRSNTLVRNVARSQSRDMLLKGYFSHNSPDGKGLGDRLTAAKVEFQGAAENIALAPTVDLAHLGLMNSEKHKVNILDPTFTEIGIGIIDAGPYGIMVTQDFIK